MKHDELVTAAKGAIGEGGPDDYVLTPKNHADLLDSQASALAKILRKSECRAVAEQYDA